MKKEIINKNTGYWLILLLFLTIGLNQVKAQQEPQYTQYMFNTVSVNPAYAGTRDAISALLLSRSQWVGIEGAPKSYNFTVHSPISYYNMGLGLSVISDNYGPVKNFYINVDYSFRFALTEAITLSMGLKGGLYNYYVGLNELNAGEADATFSGVLDKKLQPNAGLGLYVFGEKFYAGLAVPKFFQTDIGKDISAVSGSSELRRHYFLMAGYIMNINKDFKFKPSFLYKMVEGAPPTTDITAQVLYQEKYWFGLTYRIGNAVAFIGNFQVNAELMVGYSYDYALSDISTFNSGSHEIILSYDFRGFKKEKMVSTRYF